MVRVGKESERQVSQSSSRTEIDAFVQRMATMTASKARRGRLVFAMDATSSREPSWDQACQIHGEMFEATESLGGLDVQLAYFRGYSECRTSPWMSQARDLLQRMAAVRCQAGQTQIGRILTQAIKETKQAKVNAVVYVGDCVEEDSRRLGDLAGELGLLGVPVFVFHEMGDREAPRARPVFEAIAKRSGGAYCPFDASSPQQLKDLLSAVAVYAAGGRLALEHYGRGKATLVGMLTYQPNPQAA
ncbi:MAG: VWA domain-containing protein [Azospirillum sp.]|nr:VWA domain-containing protein [Azospirillum sp.]